MYAFYFTCMGILTQTTKWQAYLISMNQFYLKSIVQVSTMNEIKLFIIIFIEETWK
jgi:hypothetical protein